jgi:pSer/pThr/pTyr-binding forkhead associated (FHA) protein
MLEAELKVTSGKQAGKTISLPAGKFLVGREEDCHLRPNNDLISRHHCVFALDEYALRVRDLGSTNGTFVNGERIRSGVVLKTGDQVSIGKLEFEVTVRDPASEETQAELRLDSDTQVGTPQPQQEESFEAELGEILASADDGDSAAPSPGQDTMTEIPAAQPPSGDTQFIPPAGAPMQQPLGYPPMYPQQMMPYGYPGYPGMYPQQQMGYPMMPGMYPPQPMPDPSGQMPQQQEQAESAQKSEPAIRLPDPSETGVQPPQAPDPNAAPEKKSAEAKAKEEAPGSAADIIQQYLKRRPGGSS